MSLRRSAVQFAGSGNLMMALSRLDIQERELPVLEEAVS